MCRENPMVIEGWQLLNPLATSGAVQRWMARRVGETQPFVASVLVSAEEREQEHFGRQAFLGAQLSPEHCVPVVFHSLDNRVGLLIQPDLGALSLSDWLAKQPQRPPLAMLVQVFRSVLEALAALHRMGYQHGNLSHAHVLVLPDGSIRLDGLTQCEPVGREIELRRPATRFDAPETRRSKFEASSAQDIYAAAVLIAEVVGHRFLSTRIARVMLAASAEERPTASELLPLFLDLEHQAFGVPLAAA